MSVYNIYEKNGEWGGRRSQTAYCGMILEKNNNVYRYYCNDVYSDNISFDKLVFELEVIQGDIHTNRPLYDLTCMTMT